MSKRKLTRKEKDLKKKTKYYTEDPLYNHAVDLINQYGKYSGDVIENISIDDLDLYDNIPNTNCSKLRYAFKNNLKVRLNISNNKITANGINLENLDNYIKIDILNLTGCKEFELQKLLQIDDLEIYLTGYEITFDHGEVVIISDNHKMDLDYKKDWNNTEISYKKFPLKHNEFFLNLIKNYV